MQMQMQMHNVRVHAANAPDEGGMTETLPRPFFWHAYGRNNHT
jgi:hypothetical protein